LFLEHKMSSGRKAILDPIIMSDGGGRAKEVHNDDDVDSMFANAAPDTIVKQKDREIRKNATGPPKKPCLEWHSVVYLLILAGCVLYLMPADVKIISPVAEHALPFLHSALSKVCASSCIDTAVTRDIAHMCVSSQSRKINVTEIAPIQVKLHSHTTYPHPSHYVVPPVSPDELRTKRFRGRTFVYIAAMLMVPFQSHAYEGNMLCMHQLMHELPNSVRICVMKRHYGGEFLPMINPKLRGYSDTSASTVKSESPLSCKGARLAKKRRDVIEVLYYTVDGVLVRSLLEDGAEPHEFQMLLDEMTGTYNCSSPPPPPPPASQTGERK